MAQDLAALHRDYSKDYEKYERLAAKVAGMLLLAAHNSGLNPTVTNRPKDMRSLLKKCVLYDGPVHKVRDRAGVKVVARYEAEIVNLRDIVEQKFEIVSGPDVKAESYKPGELGYLGVHYHVHLKPDSIDTGSEDLAKLECEIILHTSAETLWDSISHQLIYKPKQELPPSIRRDLMRLLALVELFDKEVTHARKELVTLEGYQEYEMLDVLEKYYYQIAPTEYSRELSLTIISSLSVAISADRKARFDAEIKKFVDANRAKLKNAYRFYPEPDDYRGLFLHQPESILVFAMWDWHQNDAVKRIWLDLFPRDTLEELGAIWDVNITDH